MADKTKGKGKKKNNAQNNQDILNQLKQSYSADKNNGNSGLQNHSDSAESFSGDELQAELRSRFLSGNAKSNVIEEDEYAIDEDFLQNAYANIDDDNENYSDDNVKENGYGFFEELEEIDQENEAEMDMEEAYPYDKEASDSEGDQALRQGAFKEHLEDGEILLREEMEEIQEEEYYQADEEIYEAERGQENQEGDTQSIPLSDESEYYYLDEDEDVALDDSIALNENETIDDIDELSDIYGDKDEKTASEISEDNYVGMFYREIDPYENIPFKDRIVENAPTVDSLEAALSSYVDDPEDFSLQEFAEAESIPLVLDDEVIDEIEIGEPGEKETRKSFADTSELDRSDLALLLEFGYKEELLQEVSTEDIEKLSDEELISNIIIEESEATDSASSTENKATADSNESEPSAERTKIKIQKQYDEYREKRGGLLLRFIISAIFAFGLFIYELLPAVGVEFSGILNREDYLYVYVLLGLQMLILVALPAISAVYDSMKRFISSGIDAYMMASVSFTLTLIYDLIIIFERRDIPTTFHFCAAAVILLAELSELMRLNTEIKNYEYYFLEYVFDGDVEERELYKYTLVRNEGRGSVAEKMYAGGLDEKTVVCAPHNVDSASGFFEASKILSKRNRFTFGWMTGSAVAAFILTIVSGIIYEQVWVAASAFLITFNLSLPLIAIITEWLPFAKLSSQSYSYGATFASEGAAESVSRCDMLVFNDMHLFEKCDAKNVNLAIYDSTSKAVLLSCLNAVYSEIGGPLESAFAGVKVQSLGKCKVNRVAKSGVEAFVGSSYSVLIGDEQFMSRYGVFFPSAALGKEEDKIFTLCVSINNRATARIAVKYRINPTFYAVAQKLLEDKIGCSVQTYDPMISSELVTRVRAYKGAPIHIVHKSASELALEKHGHKSGAFYSVMGEKLSVLARGSRLNLAVSLSNAKKLRSLRRILNICSGTLVSLGAVVSLFLVLSEHLQSVNWLVVLIYWLLSAGITVGLFIWRFPQKDRFIFRKKNSKDE